MNLSTHLFGKSYIFKSVKEVLAKSNEPKSGDTLAGIAARDAKERVAAKIVLSDLTIKDVTENPAVPYEQDEVTRICMDDLDGEIYKRLSGMTIGELRDHILSCDATELHAVGCGLTPECAAAVAKLMGNMDLIFGASRIRVTATCCTTIGERGVLASRLQPNHPSDDLDGITASVLEGLSYGVGDAVIGLNPVDDRTESVSAVLRRLDEIKQKYAIPTQICVLAHVTTQMDAVRKGAPSDLIFQSVAGSQKGNESFGVSAAMLEEARSLALSTDRAKGRNVMYFETGQGSELSADAHFGTDQVTMDARCYGFARHFAPFLVNTVVGFIGPEYLFDSQQVIRAGLEDHFMAKLLGLPMGCDACYTNHMRADQNDIENLTVLLASAGCNYFMGVPHGDDVMLGYQSTGFHETATLRRLLQLRPIPEFETWLEEYGFWENGAPTRLMGDGSALL
jgi:ethanolamine ammonia-lyase large subunit